MAKATHRLRTVELLEARQALAFDLATISGTTFEDLTGNGLSGDDPRLSAVTVTLRRDGGNGTFDNGAGDDVLVGTTNTNATGQYRFDNLAAGRYWVVQSAVPGLIGPSGPSAIVITPQQAGGDSIAAIDNFSQTAQSLTADGDDPTATSIVAAAEVIGGERDISINLSSGTLPLTLSIDNSDSNLLAFGAELGVTGQALIQYDGADGSIALNTNGLSGVDLTGGRTGAGIRLSAFGDQTGATATIRIFSGAGNSSSAQFVIPNQGAVDQFFIPFTAFTTLSGSGANFTSVGAIEVFIQGVPSLDSQVTVLSSQAPNIQTADFANTTALTLGDRVWRDLNNNGLLDGTETGIAEVSLNLYRDTDNNGTLNPATDTLAGTTVTAANGIYSFAGLLGGNYLVQIPPAEFAVGGTLFGYIASTGGGQPADPDNNVNGDNNGSLVQGLGIVSGAITLLAGAEPTNDGDEDADTNLTLDFGVVPQGDVAINKSRTTTEAVAGSNVVYALVVTNNGPIAATNVIVTDPLPSGTAFVSAIATQGTVGNSNGQVTANLGTLAPGASATINLTLSLDPDATGTLSNTATVTSAEPDTVPANNTDGDTANVIRRADLRITKTDTPDPVQAGSGLVYTLTVTNDGPSTATAVVVTDVLPTGISFVSANTTIGTVTNNAGTVTANLGALEVGESATITINTLTATTTIGSVSNTATVTLAESDPDTTDNSRTVTTTVQQRLDLALTKQIVTPGGAIVGGQLVYQMVVTNAGPSPATGVTVTDQLPAGLTFVSGTVPGGTVTANGAAVIANVGTLANGASVTINVTANVGQNASGSLVNSATVTSNQTDTNLSNNTASVSTVVDTRNASIAGRVFVDLDEDQLFDPGEPTLAGVTISLNGNESGGLALSRTVVTASDGTYVFSGLAAGSYRVAETQPVNYRDGDAIVGSGATAVAADNLFTQLALGRAAQATDFNFSELKQFVSKRRLLASAPPRT